LECVRAALEQSPHRSAWHHAQSSKLTRHSLGCLLEDLKFHPYKLQVVQELRNIEKGNRHTTRVNILAMMNQELLFLQHLLMSDEANYFLSGYLNKQHFRYWSHENPLLLYEKP
jgi:hypothetical protein